MKDDLLLYPNPTEGNLRIEASNQLENVTIKIKNQLGQQEFYQEYVNQAKPIDISIDGSAGIYLIEIFNQDNKKSYTQKVCKQ